MLEIPEAAPNWKWMTHPSHNNGNPIPVFVFVEQGVTYYRPFDTEATEFEWELRDDEWAEFAAPKPQADGRGVAWSDLKIAFDIPGGEDETLWKCVESGAITFPNGWKLIETTGAGGVGPVAIFRTEHLPTSSETFVVGSAINYAITASKENPN